MVVMVWVVCIVPFQVRSESCYVHQYQGSVRVCATSRNIRKATGIYDIFF